VPGLSNVASGWVDYYVTTTETPRELATESRSIAVRLRLVGHCAETSALLMATTERTDKPVTITSSTARSADFQ
jgi:hypothetical protein